MKRITISMLAVAAAMLASGQPAMAASCNGNGHQIVLSNGSATPGAGTTSTSIRFSVRYADTAGCAPSRVVVVVQGVGTYPLSGSGSDYTAGATFSRTLSLPAGSHAYSFKATSGKKAGALSSVSPSKVTITAPTPRPTPRARHARTAAAAIDPQASRTSTTGPAANANRGTHCPPDRIANGRCHELATRPFPDRAGCRRAVTHRNRRMVAGDAGATPLSGGRAVTGRGHRGPRSSSCPSFSRRSTTSRHSGSSRRLDSPLSADWRSSSSSCALVVATRWRQRHS